MSLFKKVSIKDIAEAAGVSTTLVSFVLNGKSAEYRVSDETAKRIRDIAENMRYQPNLAAQSLRGGRSNIIGVVVSDISNPFFSSLARLFEDISGKYGYTVFFGSSDERPDRMRKVIGNLISRGVDGVIIVPCEKTEKFLTKLSTYSVPMVLLDRYFENSKIPYVGLNNYQATYQATQYLFEKGYRKPAIVAYDMKLIHMQERIRGYREAMQYMQSTTAPEVYYTHLHNTMTEIHEVIKTALDKGVDSFIFATNLISLSCLYMIRNMHDKATDNLGLVGFDGNPAFDFFDKPIAYIKQPLEEIAKHTFTALVDAINNKEPKSMLINGELVVIEHNVESASASTNSFTFRSTY
ncbi:MAG: LacI family DNA-binding transcriptional regulator [Prevotella sp.]|jgi:LacI family transcriptional regulator